MANDDRRRHNRRVARQRPVSSTNADKPQKQLWLIASQGETHEAPAVEVALRMRTCRLYSYSVPAALAAEVQPGTLLRVPYGRSGRLVEGWCVRRRQAPYLQTLKPIAEVLPARLPLSEKLIELGLWTAEYYGCWPARTLEALVPAIMRQKRYRTVQYVRRTEAEPGGRLSSQQQRLLEVLAPGPLERHAALAAAQVSAATLRSLQKRGLIELSAVREPAPEEPPDQSAPPAEVPPTPEDGFQLTPGQSRALEVICRRAQATDGRFGVIVLFGVPGSGKTEVYVRAIRAVIAGGRQAIVLVPEIALATQVVQRLARRFARVAVLHSRLPAAARRRTINAIRAGQVDVVIGTRTAVFAPCPRLGLLVVDEEQETSFKNLQAPFFHARDVAIKRGQLEDVPVVLGSATPALETWHNARTLRHYELCELPERVPGAALPEVRVARSVSRRPDGEPGGLSGTLVAELRKTLEAGDQAILLHNRRGYATHLRCGRCGMAVGCPRCGAHLVYHRADERLKCHRCGAWRDVPRTCLDQTCGGVLLRVGAGIQRLERELEQRFPRARLLRLDSDTMRRREDYAAALERFARREADILIGTQMVAKGLDFPGVRLVGVLDADAALWLPDFRAAETVFQLLVQVVGRAGRREGQSLALLQADDPTHPVIAAACKMDYAAFAASELAVRRELGDPPFARLIRLILADKQIRQARDQAAELALRWRELAGRVHAGIRLEEPTDCVVPRLRELHRVQVLVRLPRGLDPRVLLRRVFDEKLAAPRVARFTIDVDPVDML